MKTKFFILIFLFPSTNQIICPIACSTSQLTRNQPFQNSTECPSDTRAIKCYGRIMVYYNKTDYPEYISYTFGSRKHIVEKEIEELANKNPLKFIIYFLFLIESLYKDEVIITAYIICQTTNDCASNYIKNLFDLYSNQKNPIDKFDHLSYKNSEELSELICYDYETKQMEDCSINQFSTCIFHNDKNLYHQGCHSDRNIRIEYEFLILSSEKKTSLEKISELIICNKDNCNKNLIIEKIENIIYNITFGNIISFEKNLGNKIQFNFFLILMFKFFFMI